MNPLEEEQEDINQLFTQELKSKTGSTTQTTLVLFPVSFKLDPEPRLLFSPTFPDSSSRMKTPLV
jgi:hypothetical protein